MCTTLRFMSRTMTKVLLLITGLVVSTTVLADMDRICHIALAGFFGGSTTQDIETQIISKKCERNNVLEIVAPENNESTRALLTLYSNQFCRFDRNRNIEGKVLSCILYSTKARRDL